MAILYEQYDVPEQLGTEITIPDRLPAIYVSENNEVYCFTGILLNNDEQHQFRLYKNPYYMHGKHSTDKKFATQIKGFFRIKNGCIMLDKYIDNQYSSEIKYKLIEAFIRFPKAADIYYGVEKCKEDEAITRAVFGLTCSELNSILKGYAKLLGRYNMYIQYPRLTRSTSASNYCDITDIWIPEQFLYITFEESSYDFSHVSLWGFYRHTQLLMEKRISSRFGQALLTAGVKEAALSALLSVDGYPCYYLPKVTRDILIKR